MTGYALRRGLLILPQLLLIITALFFVTHLPPGGPADILLGSPGISTETVSRLNAAWGLDRPLTERYVRWLGNLSVGDWGYSFAQRREVTAVVLERLPNTLILSGVALVVSLLIGVPLGILMAVKNRAWYTRVAQVASIIMLSVPTFWLGAMVIIVFSVNLGWLPSGGMATIGTPFSLADRAWHLIGPVSVLSGFYIAQWARFMYTQVSEVATQDFVRTARSKGISQLRILTQHVTPNSLMPLVSLVGVEAPRILSGAIVTEVVFSWPGLGRLVTQSLLQRDYMVTLGATMLLAVAVLVSSLVTDLAYGAIDPRVRYS